MKVRSIRGERALRVLAQIRRARPVHVPGAEGRLTITADEESRNRLVRTYYQQRKAKP